MNPAIESLEMRTLLSSAKLTDEGLLKIKGDDGVNDTIVVRRDGAELDVLINGQVRRSVDRDDVEGIAIYGKSGNDTLRIDDTSARPIAIPATLDGDAGNDRLAASNSVNSRVRGNEGDDLIDGRGVLLGGAGNDEFDASNFRDMVFGGPGRDSIDGENGNDVLFGGADNDTVEGDRGDDHVFGDEGDDRVEGGFGNDSVFGNAGVDSVFGDDGDDTLYGGGAADSDVVNGNEGNDVEDPEEFADLDDLVTDFEDESDTFA